MTEDRLPLAELLAKAGDGDFLRSVAQHQVRRWLSEPEGFVTIRLRAKPSMSDADLAPLSGALMGQA